MVLVYDFIRIHIYKFPLKFFISSSLYYLLFILVLALIFVATRLIIIKIIKIDILVTWPILFLVFLRLSIHSAFPLLNNTAVPVIGALIVSLFILIMDRKRQLSFLRYLLFVSVCFILFMIFLQSSSIIFILLLWSPVVVLIERKIFKKISTAGVFILIVFSLYTATSIPNSNTAPSVEKANNVIFIVLDTARKDCFDLDSSESVTPNLNKLSQEGTVLNKFIANGAWTPPAHASFFTGLLPSKNGVFHYENDLRVTPLADELLTLAEILQQNMINTQGFYANSYISDVFGFGQGFNQYVFLSPSLDSIINRIMEVTDSRVDKVLAKLLPKLGYKFKNQKNKDKRNSNPVALSEDVFSRAGQWLAKNGQRKNFFLFLNIMEQHYIRYFYDEEKSKIRIGPCYYTEGKEQLYLRPETVLDKNEALLDWHKLTIKNIDYHLGKFLDLLKRQGLYDNTTIIVTSDHGHLFGEWAHYGHEDNIYAPNIFIPFIIKYAKVFHSRDIIPDRVYQQVDVFSEILDLFGIPVPENSRGIPFPEVQQKLAVTQLYRMADIPTKLKTILDKDMCGAILHWDNAYFQVIYKTDGEHEMYKINDFAYVEPKNLYEEFKHELQVKEIINISPELMHRKIYDAERLESKEMLEKLKSLGYIK